MILDYFHNEGVDISGLATYLESLDVATATFECFKLKLTHQRALFEAALGWRPLAFVDLVPASATIGEQVIHAGRNTSLIFNEFQKRFGRFSLDGAIYGYNNQIWMCITGAGYFTAESGDHGEIHLDGRKVPPTAPPDWPTPRSNADAIFPWIYENLIDVLRGVSQRVIIGRPTYVGNEPADSYFILVRQ